jgi:hypothetical protein
MIRTRMAIGRGEGGKIKEKESPFGLSFSLGIMQL